ncbi:hypothetical protein GCM10008090_06880 [Arenicella chitinivorans]|uniref:Uncharacterized protein n=1 Tax=Arenicella chitinivorans TaxID=1329800 RepID=A0A918RHV9_9GAMM|nr:hypothetical protein [Arenicella chitinivorans]GHA00602.1 hypothetical protein GCM10008090_06880 [Arenicella chitinivorans]
MPRKIDNTIVPRNPVARAASKRRAGVHERSRTSERQAQRNQVTAMRDDWRDDLEFEASLKSDNVETDDES